MVLSRGAAEVPPMPPHLQLEVTSACNLRCRMCLVRYRPPVNKIEGAMSPELFRRILDALPGLRRLTLQGLGEPLLHPHLIPMLTEAKRHGIEAGFNTNATLLTARRSAELVGLGVDWVHVSLDGATAGTYEAIREGGRFDAVADNLRGLWQAKRAAGTRLPWTRVVFVAMRRNLGELPDVVRLLAGWGVDELRVQNLAHTFEDADGGYAEIRAFTEAESLWNGEDRSRAAEVFAETETVAAEHGVHLRLPGLEERPARRRPGEPGCSWPWEAAYVTSEGVVQPCCMVMGDDRITLGDLRSQSLEEIWAGEPYREFRRRLTGDDPPEVCRGCALYRGTF
ncbi:SPASM domain-containing protein [Streptosporangium sandarakinum]|uniref:Radical SAM protein with 4Fe4S-binding SPASM domain n=1 Tax=Streptosporangium sandarakinum TaxID=1260955 RepID=A0A852USD7_9ACTN|nr:radical SAM protein [Streptosporangium sandarakinum]NYF38518.1 radical SAM protein with 4Fe4S-binding SPASM domain [Streptosporangium sandarakinum]